MRMMQLAVGVGTGLRPFSVLSGSRAFPASFGDVSVCIPNAQNPITPKTNISTV
jgi:hypothetical protein